MSNLYSEKINLEIREMVKRKMNLLVEAEQIEDSLLFGTAAGFDSTSLLEFIIELEEYFDVIIPDEDLIPDNFASVSKITDYVIQLKAR